MFLVDSASSDSVPSELTLGHLPTAKRRNVYGREEREGRRQASDGREALPGVAARAQGDYVVVEDHVLLVRLLVPQLLDVKTSVEVAGDKYRHVVPLWLAAPCLAGTPPADLKNAWAQSARLISADGRHCPPPDRLRV